MDAMAMRNLSIRLPDTLLEKIERAREVETTDGEKLLRSRNEVIVKLLKRAMAEESKP